jgi:hypothetical protein
MTWVGQSGRDAGAGQDAGLGWDAGAVDWHGENDEQGHWVLAHKGRKGLGPS